MHEAPLTLAEGASECPGCGSDHVIKFTRITRVAWVLLIAGLAFAPFTVGFSLVFPVAALFLREPRWECESCWRRGPVNSDHAVRPAWSHLPPP